MSETTRPGPGAPAGGQPPAHTPRPPASSPTETGETWALTRTVLRDGLRLDVWSSVAPSAAPAAGDRAPYALEERLRKPFTLKLGRRKRRVFYVSLEQARRQGGDLAAVGWYVNTVRPPASWMNNDPFGPYRTIRALLDDAGEAYAHEEE